MFLYSTTNNMSAYMKEQFGSVLEDSKQPFLRKHIAAFRQRPLYRFNRAPDAVFVAVDSACGGKCEVWDSLILILILLLTGARCVVCRARGLHL